MTKGDIKLIELLGINIRQFEDSEDFGKYISETGELNVDDLVNDFSESESETNDDSSEIEEDVIDDDNNEVDELEEEIDDSAGETPQAQGEEKRTPDQAFAEMRRQLEANEPLAKWVHDLAKQQGFQDPQELIDAYEEQRIAREAEAQGVPVDVYRRLHDLEQENKTAKEQVASQQFNYEVEATKNKYNLSDDDLNKVFQFMGQNGYVDDNNMPTIAFEDAYVLANRESLIKDAEERGRQAYLEEKQQQQQQATPIVKTDVNDKTGADELDYSKEGIFNTFKSMGIDID